MPPDADLVFDVRFLPNPHFVPSLRPCTGRNPRVARYVLRAPAARRFLRLTTALLRFLLPQYIAEGKTLSHHRDRLHRRAPPVGRDCRGAGARVEACAQASGCGTATRG